MSKLNDNENVPCSECGFRLEEITFCKSVMKDVVFNSIPYNRRCGNVVCPLCEYCRSCFENIESKKRDIRSSRDNPMYDYKIDHLEQRHGVIYDYKCAQ